MLPFRDNPYQEDGLYFLSKRIVMYGEFSYLCDNNLICEKSTLMKNNIIS